MRTKETICPNCGHKINAATEVGGDGSPSPGDGTVCAYCYGFFIFAEDLTLRGPTPQEEEEYKNSEAWALVQKARVSLQSHFGSKKSGLQ